MILLQPRPTLFPYTTLFRSRVCAALLLSQKAELAGKLPDVFDRDGDAANGTRSKTGARIRRQTDHQLDAAPANLLDRKSTRLNSSHTVISYAVFWLKKKNED